MSDNHQSKHSSEYLDHLRHSCAHLLAAAVMELYPFTHRTIGPAIENGFYFDFEFQQAISEEDLPKIEEKMREIVKNWKGFEKEELDAKEAKEQYPGNPYKAELIEEFSEGGKKKVSFYKSGDYHDLCKGGHIEHPDRELKHFKLLSIAGAYWKGSEKNTMLTRIYGTCWPTKAELDTHLQQLEEAKLRDHRRLGRELELFHFDDEIGPGLPIWLPKGNIIKDTLENWAKETEHAWGYQRVTTPLITKENLFYTSGHLPLYKESMYSPIQIEEENYYIKPMNCPFHHKVFSSKNRSYRELPLRIAEYGWCHRYEDSGSLFGLMRVRGMSMNDAHIYVSQEEAVDEFLKVIQLHEYYYQQLGITTYEMELALRNPNKMDKYHGSEEDWKLAEEMTLEAMKKSGVPFKVVHDGAAFYGPKMDFQITSSIGRVFTASTNQLDLYMGKKFHLEYTDKDGNSKTPVIIHRAPLGTHERFIGFLLEHFAGAFPLWLSPVQVTIVPISEHHAEYAKSVQAELEARGLRVELSAEAESMQNRIRKAAGQKVPYILVMGDKEIEAKAVAVRQRGNKNLGTMSVNAFADLAKQEVDQKTIW